MASTIIIAILAISLVIFPGIGTDTAQAVEASSWGKIKAQQAQPEAAAKRAAKSWNKLKRWEKEQLILETALKYEGRVMGSCKEFVRKAIVEASNGAAYVPSNLPDWTGWKYSSDFSSKNIPIENVRRGQFIQMRLRFRDGSEGPHTCMVAWKWGNYMGWIDANWSKKRDGKVRYHTMSISQFKRMTTGYSIITLK